MILAHATPHYSAGMIRVHGLRPDMAQTVRSVVWAVSPSRWAWAVDHAAARHSCAVRDMYVCLVRVVQGGHWRRQSAGIWCCDRIIRPQRILWLGPATQAHRIVAGIMHASRGGEPRVAELRELIRGASAPRTPDAASSPFRGRGTAEGGGA